MHKSVITILFCALLAIGKTFGQERVMKMQPIAGGKIFFADKPFTTNATGSKDNFSSSGFIYGRLELGEQTIQQAFKMTTEDYSHYYLRCWVMVFKNGEEIGQHQSWEYIYIKKGDQNKTFLNFDILPEPVKASTAMAADGFFDGGKAAGPLYQQVRPDMFSENGEYTIKVRLCLETNNAWGTINPVSEWPMLQGEFKFQFNGNDVATILSNYKKANEVVTAKMKK